MSTQHPPGHMVNYTYREGRQGHNPAGQISLLYQDREDSIGKNPSPILTRDKTKMDYISEGQTLTNELAFGIELGLKSHSKNLRGRQGRKCNYLQDLSLCCGCLSPLPFEEHVHDASDPVASLTQKPP